VHRGGRFVGEDTSTPPFSRNCLLSRILRLFLSPLFSFDTMQLFLLHASLRRKKNPFLFSTRFSEWIADSPTLPLPQKRAALHSSFLPPYCDCGNSPFLLAPASFRAGAQRNFLRHGKLLFSFFFLFRMTLGCPWPTARGGKSPELVAFPLC